METPKSYNFLKPIIDSHFAASNKPFVSTIWNQYRYAYLKLWLRKTDLSYPKFRGRRPMLCDLASPERTNDMVTFNKNQLEKDLELLFNGFTLGDSIQIR